MGTSILVETVITKTPTVQEDIPIKIIDGLSHGGDMLSILRDIMDEIKGFVHGWRDHLAGDPAAFRKMEWAAQRLGTRITGLLVALVLADSRIGAAAEQEGLREKPDRLRAPRLVERWVRLPGGMRVKVETAYCAPKTGAKKKCKRGSEGSGVYPAFAVLGIFEGKTPLTAELLLRFSLQMPSFESARNELDMLGHTYGSKMAGRTVRDYGKQALEARNAEMEAWRKGKLIPEETFAGRKVVASVDGGRLRIRYKKKRTRNGKKRKFKAEWKEPKLLIIYVLDEHGKRDKKVKIQLDATMSGPDEAMELLTFHLYRLGAGDAELVEFIADGAPWIWNRVDEVIARAGLDPKRCRRVLDYYHACEHISAGLDAGGLTGREKKRQLSRLKNLLKAGKAEDVLLCLQGYLGRTKTKAGRKTLKGHIAYLRKRLPMLRYATFARRKLALGSGAVESGIRRVINLRVKSPSTFWDADTAEAMIHMRSQLLSDRWDEMMERIRKHSLISRQRNYLFTPTIRVEDKQAA
jgi:hypothetical protein